MFRDTKFLFNQSSVLVLLEGGDFQEQLEQHSYMLDVLPVTQPTVSRKN